MFCNKIHAVTKRSQRCVHCKKSRRDFVARTFCINCTSSPHFAPSFMQLQNDPKCTQTLWNTPKHEFRVQWGGSGAFVGKNYNVTSWHELFALIVPVPYVLHRVSCSYEMIPNASKHYETHQNMWLRCEKLQCDFVARTFVLIALVQYVLHQLSCSCETIRNAPEY